MATARPSCPWRAHSSAIVSVPKRSGSSSARAAASTSADSSAGQGGGSSFGPAPLAGPGDLHQQLGQDALAAGHATVVVGGEAHGRDDGGQELVVRVLDRVPDHAPAGLQCATGATDQREGDRVHLMAGAVLLAVADGDDGVVQ